jgi:hypothetical protein
MSGVDASTRNFGPNVFPTQPRADLVDRVSSYAKLVSGLARKPAKRLSAWRQIHLVAAKLI